MPCMQLFSTKSVILSGSRSLREAESKDPEGGGSDGGVWGFLARVVGVVAEMVWTVSRVWAVWGSFDSAPTGLRSG